ncbi:hypothetical protein [Sphingomonas glacialis]|uniref:hypothetical protein n=1 Tax=Sphingomonas glacialis TaxID=658225 RepID=UPI001128467C|nr:hypothetical protein [Sphingomonas glacialis]
MFESIHRTIDGATVAACVCGAAVMPDGSAITIEAVKAALRLAATISFECNIEDGANLARIERHPILV